MRQYVLYIMKNLAWPTLLITASLTGIIWLTQALRFIDFIVNRGLSIGNFIYITSLLFPSLLLLLVPVSLFVAIVFTYNKLSVDSELIVFKAVGLSRWQLAQPAIFVAIIATLFCYSISLYFLPLSNRQFNDMRTFLQDNYTSVLLQEEVFNTPVDGLTVFVRERDSDGNLKGILVHDNRIEDNPITMMAEEGKLIQSGGGPQFYLVKGMRQEIRKGHISWLNFDQYTLDIRFYTKAMNKRNRFAEEKYLGELFSGDGLSDKERAQHRAEGHQRIVWPLYNLAMALLGVAILLHGEFNRRGHWKRMMFAGMAAGAVVLAGVGLRNVVVKQPMLIPLMYLTVVSASAAAVTSLFWDKQKTVPKTAPLDRAKEVKL